MLRRIIAAIGAGVLLLSNSCAGAKSASVEPRRSPEEEQALVRELNALGYMDSEQDAAKTERELKALGYMDSGAEQDSKTKDELKSLGYM